MNGGNKRKPTMNNPNQPFSEEPSPPAVGITGDGKTKDARMWAMFCHLSALAGFVVTVPFAGVIGPLVLWLIKRDEFPFVNDQGKESVNFQISMAVYYLVSVALAFLLIGIPLLIALAVFNLVCVILATIKANEGECYRYPLCIRFIK